MIKNISRHSVFSRSVLLVMSITGAAQVHAVRRMDIAGVWIQNSWNKFK